jgi:hypothetical protein
VLAIQGNGHDLDAAIAVAAVLVVFRYAILRLVLGTIAVVIIASLVYGAVLLAPALQHI